MTAFAEIIVGNDFYDSCERVFVGLGLFVLGAFVAAEVNQTNPELAINLIQTSKVVFLAPSGAQAGVGIARFFKSRK